MSIKLNNFNKKKEYLICIDSDGCAIDTMDVKHIKCFGPCMVNEWNLEVWKDEILQSWNEVNLYTLTRGINRFKGLAIALAEINEKYIRIDGINEYLNWINTTKELSNESLEKEIKNNTGNLTCIKKALAWSIDVNKCINTLGYEEKLPFEGVAEAIKKANSIADVAIVSSANEKAVLEEWEYHSLLNDVDIVLTQNIGSKAYCISKLLEKGYNKENVLMVGDALGDYEAAKSNEVLYYPILVRNEKQSWNNFITEAIDKLINKSYNGDYQEKLINSFKKNLSKNN